MEKGQIRKEFFKLKLKGHSYTQCKIILKARYSYEITIRTLMRWMNKLDNYHDWDLKDTSKRPKTIHKVMTSEIENKIIKIRNKTGWGENKIADFVEVSSWSVNKILKKHKHKH